MSSPRDRDRDGFDAGRRGQRLAGAGAPRASRRADRRAASPTRPSRRPGSRPAGTCRPPTPDRTPPAAARRRRRSGPAARASGTAPARRSRWSARSAYETDLVGAQGWALQHGWTISDGEGPQDAVLRGPAGDRARCGPARRRGRPACCAAARAPWSSSPSTSSTRSGRSLVPKYAVTAAPAARRRARAAAVPRPVLAAPAPAGSCRCASGNEAFDAPLAAARRRGRPAGAPPGPGPGRPGPAAGHRRRRRVLDRRRSSSRRSGPTVTGRS